MDFASNLKRASQKPMHSSSRYVFFYHLSTGTFVVHGPPPAGIELEKIGFGAFFALELHEKDGELRCSFKGFLLVHVGAVYAHPEIALGC